jgi:tRNA pseudouridine55 synthase
MPSGVLLLDKPLGLSSNAALQRVRTLFARAKAGHVGSLDPLATGMLPICLGEATKIAGDIVAGRKRYRFSVALGSATTTGDAEGQVTHTAVIPALTPALVSATLERFLGAQTQVPPMYSALKRDGQPLYKLARAGLTVPRAPRAIELFDLALLNFAPQALELETSCSKGTYIRVLAQDIAAALGTSGHVAALRRLWVEPFADEPMHTLESLYARAEGGETLPLLPLDWPLQHLPALHLSVDEAQRFAHGQKVPSALRAACARLRIYDPAARFMGLGETDPTGVLQPRRLFNWHP